MQQLQRIPARGARSAVAPEDGSADASNRLYRSLFVGALVCVAVSAIWGRIDVMVDARVANGSTGVTVGLGLAVAGSFALWRRSSLYALLRTHPPLLIAGILLVAAALVLLGRGAGYFTPVAWSVIILAAVVAGPRSRLGAVFAITLIGGYLVGRLALYGVDVSRLNPIGMHDALGRRLTIDIGLALMSILAVRQIGNYVDHQRGMLASRSECHPALNRCSELSPREVEIVRLIANGYCNREIAEQMYISPRTVQTYVDSALRKTGARHRSQLIAFAVADGL